MEINRAYRLGEITVSIPISISLTRGNTVEISRAYRLGEIVNPAAIPTYFTERSAVYFYLISIVFLLGTSYNHPKSAIFTCVLIKFELAFATIFPDSLRIAASQWFRLEPERTNWARTSNRSPTCAADKKSTDKLMLVIRNSDPATKLPIPITSSSINEAMPPCKIRPGLHMSGRTT